MPRIVSNIAPATLLAALISAPLVACAGKTESAPAANAPQTEGVLDTTQLLETFPGIDPESVRLVEDSGLYEVSQSGAYGYVTADGNYLVQGDLIDLRTGESITEARRDVHRKEIMAAVDERSMFVFPPSGETKHVVYVFTDTTCGYCQKMHREMADYHAQGIEIRYLMYPRSGPGSPSWKTAVSAWCADNRNGALTAAKSRQSIEARECSNPIMQHYVAGQAAGLRGTPLMVLESGKSISGYLPAQALVQRIQQLEG